MGIRGLALAVAFASGCSFATVRSTPHKDPVTSRPACSSRAVPAIDLVSTPVWLAAAAGIVLGRHDDTDRVANTTELVEGGVLVALSVTTLASSIYGFVTISRCHGKLEQP
ncbi:MAG TPA: hypothetical protein VL326_27090 [Kofleriaceae bacterium]|jgi:hypothetical protein|nr:hypothetical protein [Kofleriaceae bacterium]